MILLAAVLLVASSQAAAPVEVLTGIQTRGNVATSDEEMRRLAGLEIGMAVGADTVRTVTDRLKATKRFDRVEVLKRYASISDPTRVVLVLIVDEGSVTIRTTGDPNEPTRVVRSRRPNLLFLPILGGEDGYGLTYGVRLTRPEPAGRDSRLSVPLTWGGEKRAAIEFERRFTGAWITRTQASAFLNRKRNPFFDEDDDRKGVTARAERQFSDAFRAGVSGGWQAVSFRGLDDGVTNIGGDAVLDTRLDPWLARNAVYLRAARTHLTFRTGDAANRTDVEAHGYLGVFRQAILVASATRSGADGPLPDYLKPLLGGTSSLRGFKAGTDAGDTLVIGSLELRLPLSSPLSIGKIGVSAFVDAGTVYDDGQRFADQLLKRGVGGSVWFSAAFVRVNVAVAHGIGGTTRAHVSGNLTF